MLFQTKKVLVCDDQDMLRALISSVIKEKAPHLEIVQAENGKLAEEAIRSEEFEFVFMDVQMPEQDGFTTLKNIRQEELANDTPSSCAQVALKRKI